MITLLIIILLISLCCIGINVCTWQKMIFHAPAAWLKKRLPVWVHKPLFSCSICTASVWTVVLWLFYFRFDIIYLPLVMLAVAGLNTVFTGIISNIIPDEEEN